LGRRRPAGRGQLSLRGGLGLWCALAVGDNSDGQRDVDDWETLVAIAAGSAHTLGLRADGTVVSTGNTTPMANAISKDGKASEPLNDHAQQFRPRFQ
jgi:hypothetical protein